MKTSLFIKQNPAGTISNRNKHKPTCLNCTHNRRKKKNYIDARVSTKADVVFILPSNSFNAIRRVVKEWQKKHTLIDKISYLPDIMCKHDMSNVHDKKYAITNLHCSHVINKQIHSDVKHIFLVGISSVRAYFGEGYGDSVAYNKTQGFTFPDLKNNVMISVVYEPSMEALMQDSKDSCVLERTIFKQDLQRGMLRFGEDILDEWKKPEELCHTLDERQALFEMDAILEGKYTDFVAFDYETTGLKPFRKGHAAVCCSLCTSPTNSFAFMMTEATNDKLGAILANVHIPKVAANNPFEYKWSHFLGHCVNNLVYDVCLGAHLLNQRRGIVSVKFQAHMLFGILGYEKGMNKYLVPSTKETDKYGANAINTAMTAPQRQILLYCAMDSLVEYWLAVDGMNRIGIDYENES